MRYLIDTNVFINMQMDASLLGRDVWAILSNYENQLCISVESLKEALHLYQTKKQIRKVWRDRKHLLDSVSTYNIQVLDFSMDVLNKYAEMYINEFEHHNDPSDHIIVAQALLLKIPLISNDTKFSYYRNQGLDLIEY